MDEIPSKYVNQCLFIRKVFHCNRLVTFFLTKDFEFVELNMYQEIVNYLKIKEDCHDPVKSDFVRMKAFERLDSTLIFLIQLSDDNLYIIRRQNNNIELIKIFNDVVHFKIEGQCDENKADPVVSIRMKDETMEKFHDEEYNQKIHENNVDLFKIIDANLKHQKTCMLNTLEHIRRDQQLKTFALIGKQKFLPKLMRLNDTNDISPLVRFGSIFTRVCNDKVVIGIPVFNASSLERRLLLENLKLIICCSTLPNGAFKYDLFKMKTDCPSFEEFEKLFNAQYNVEDGDIRMPERPDFKVDWTRCLDTSLLYSCEAGVFVVTADVAQFVNDSSHTIAFNVSYQIQGMEKQANLIANIGQVVVDSRLIYSTELDINQYNLEKYRNLLAVTSTSEMIATMDISFEKNERIENFLAGDLNFEVIKSREDAEDAHPSSYFENPNTKAISLRLRKDYFLYCSNGYFKGTLLRVRLESDELMRAKVYARAAHQIVILVQSIYRQYPRHCKIKMHENV